MKFVYKLTKYKAIYICIIRQLWQIARKIAINIKDKI